MAYGLTLPGQPQRAFGPQPAPDVDGLAERLLGIVAGAGPAEPPAEARPKAPPLSPRARRYAALRAVTNRADQVLEEVTPMASRRLGPGPQ